VGVESGGELAVAGGTALDMNRIAAAIEKIRVQARAGSAYSKKRIQHLEVLRQVIENVNSDDALHTVKIGK